MKKLFIPFIIFIGIYINVTAQVDPSSSLSQESSIKASSGSINPEVKTTDASFAQEKSNKELTGDKYSFDYSYNKAISSYNHTKLLSLEGQRSLALAYHNMNKNTEAEAAYSKLMTATTGLLPEDYYNYAMVLKINGKYEEANKWMNIFSDLKSHDLRAKDYSANSNKLSIMMKDDGKYKIENLDINTTANDFGTSYYKNGIVFSSSRGTSMFGERKDNWTGKPFLEIYMSEMNKGQLTKPKIFDRSLDGKMNDGPASFSNNGTCMAFTRNNYNAKRKDKVINLQIYFSTYKDSKWTAPESFYLNNKDYSVGQPCLTSDGNTMYFTSDMPGGYGGTDIYRITKDTKGVWGKPENLGDKINTEGDEMFPFYEETKGVLFFSSDGRYGLGGLDVFICAVNGSEFGPVVNAGSPLNTQYDDFAVIVNDSMSKGYFSSNRTGGSGGDDIYSFDILKDLGIGKKIEGIAEDKDGNIIPKTFITLRDNKGNTLDTVTTKDDGAFVFLVDSDKKFKLSGKKEKYNEGDTVASTFGKEFIVKANVVLLKEEIVAQKVQVEVVADLGKLLELKTIYFDLDKYNIRPDAETELDKIVKVMNDNPKITVELSSYCDCRESKAYNQKLSDNRARVTTDYIKARITNPERIYGKGYGKTHLVNGCSCEDNVGSNCSDAEHQVNRRTEFLIVKK